MTEVAPPQPTAGAILRARTDVCRPEDKPGYKPPPKPQQFSPAAYHEPLQVLHDLAVSGLPMPYRDACHWRHQAEFLLESIDRHTKAP